MNSPAAKSAVLLVYRTTGGRQGKGRRLRQFATAVLNKAGYTWNGLLPNDGQDRQISVAVVDPLARGPALSTWRLEYRCITVPARHRDAIEVFRKTGGDAVAVGNGMTADLEGVVHAGVLLVLALGQRGSGREEQPTPVSAQDGIS